MAKRLLSILHLLNKNIEVVSKQEISYFHQKFQLNFDILVVKDEIKQMRVVCAVIVDGDKVLAAQQTCRQVTPPSVGISGWEN